MATEQQVVRPPAESRFLPYLLGAMGLLLLLLLLLQPWGGTSFPEAWYLGLREPIDNLERWVLRNRATHPLFAYFFTPLSSSIDWSLRRVESFLLALPWLPFIVGMMLVARKVATLRAALLIGLGLLYVGMVGLWDESMQTLALMGFSVLLALLLGFPLGILAGLNQRVGSALRPLLDTMQTMPAFVYLIPVLLFFGVARVPSVVATVIYALPPIIRMTAVGIQQVPKNTLEAATMFGSSRRQLLQKVQLPLALPLILAGINQTIMMALGIVVIASLIGAGGLGREVLISLQRLQVGRGVEAGLAIVVLAVILDRFFEGLRQERARATPPRWLPSKIARRLVRGRRHLYARVGEEGMTFWRQRGYWMASLALLLLLLLLTPLTGWDFPPSLQLNLRDGVDAGVRWMRDNLYQIDGLPIGTGPLSDAITIYALNPLRALFQTGLPWPLTILLFALLAYQGAGQRAALFTVGGFFLIGLLGMWDESMDTLSQTLVALALTALIGVPLGIAAARSDLLEALLRPLLDTFQTIPSFVFLVPVIMLFNVGRVPGIIASVIYALPPVIRLTTLGIRQVPEETVEAALAFGSTSRQLLQKVQWPLALPSILLGINQSLMMVLAMVIIAGIVGGGGLGLEAVKGLARNEVGLGFEAGLSIVILAMILDRLTQGWAQRQKLGAGRG